MKSKQLLTGPIRSWKYVRLTIGTQCHGDDPLMQNSLYRKFKAMYVPSPLVVPVSMASAPLPDRVMADTLKVYVVPGTSAEISTLLVVTLVSPESIERTKKPLELLHSTSPEYETYVS